MYTIGILESGPGLSSLLARCLPSYLLETVDLYPASQLPAGLPLDLLVISPDLKDKNVSPLDCRALLVPGRLSPLAGDIPADWAVSYGISPKDSLTFSSLGEEEICLALQREVVTLEGDCLERQELLLPRGGHTSPLHVLACAGVQLLLGVPPAEVEVRAKDTLPCGPGNTDTPL